MKVYLDDERETPDGWWRTYTVAETIRALQTLRVTELSLDHDLGLPDEDGYDVLLWIEEEVVRNGYKPPIIHVHTANPPARKRMLMAVGTIYDLSERF